jgi:hypothetical protein
MSAAETPAEPEEARMIPRPFVWPAPTHIRGKPVPQPKPPKPS